MSQLSSVYKQAIVNKPILDNFLTKVGRQSGGKPISNFKSPTTAVEKVEEKKAEDPGRDYSLSKVNDIARARLVYNSRDALMKGVDDFKRDIKATPMKVVKTENFFQKPEDGYMGYHIDVAFPNGQHSEVQFHTTNSYAAALATHKTHEEYGDNVPSDAAKRNEEANARIMSLPEAQAQKIADTVEQQNAPIQNASQVEAFNAALGNKMTRLKQAMELAKGQNG